MIELISLSKKVNDSLEKNGWTQDSLSSRESSILLLWKKKKYDPSNAAIQFVKRFDGLKLEHEAYRSQDLDYSIFDTLKATSEIHTSWIFEVYNELAKSKLIPIGQGYSEHLTYFISDDYKFYGGYDDYFCFIGDSINSFFENILFHKEFKKIN